MSRRSRKKKQEETVESAVEELDDALGALSGGDSPDETVDEGDGNPLEQVDVSGTTHVVAYWTDMREQACFPAGTCGHGEDAYFAYAS